MSIDEETETIFWSLWGEIRRCGLGGENRSTVLNLHPPGCPTCESSVLPLALDTRPIDATHTVIYWTERDRAISEGRIMRADVYVGYGVSPDTLVTGLAWPLDIVVDATGGKIYWVDAERRKVERANLDGTAVESLVDTEVDPSSIVLDRSSAKLIWVGQTTGRVQRSNLDGSGVEDVFTRQNIWHLDIGPGVLVPVQQRSWSDVKNLLR